MRKIISILLAFILVIGISAVSFAYSGFGEESPNYFIETTKNFTYSFAEPRHGVIVAEVDIDVTFEYDGLTAIILNIDDNSWVHPDYRLSGSATQSGDSKVVLSYTCVPLSGDGGSMRFNKTLTATPNGNLI